LQCSIALIGRPSGIPRRVKVSFSFADQDGDMRVLGLLLVWLACLLGPTLAEPVVSAPAAGALCRPAIAAAESAAAIPAQLMAAIGRVESGRVDPASGRTVPWPWTINAEGQGSFYETKAQAIAAVRALQARGVRSIDVGCMQVNLMHHPDAFATLDQAFDPAVNAAYAARFLTELHAQTNDWPRAVGLYHSATPELAGPYREAVWAAWTGERRVAGVMPRVGTGLAPGPSGMPSVGGGGFRGAVPGGIARGAAVVGRDLAAYRAAPIVLAVRGPVGGTRN
jgi:hypothetical protein